MSKLYLSFKEEKSKANLPATHSPTLQHSSTLPGTTKWDEIACHLQEEEATVVRDGRAITSPPPTPISVKASLISPYIAHRLSLAGRGGNSVERRASHHPVCLPAGAWGYRGNCRQAFLALHEYPCNS